MKDALRLLGGRVSLRRANPPQSVVSSALAFRISPSPTHTHTYNPCVELATFLMVCSKT